MQILARDGLTTEQVRAIIEGDVRDASVYGAEVLDLDGTLVGDLSSVAPGRRSAGIVGGGGDLTGLVITHDTTVPVPTDVKLTCTRELDWPNVRVRPWQELNGVRFYGGLYGLETPTQSPAEGEFTVQGYGVLSNLRVAIHDTIVIPITETYLNAARRLIDSAGVPGLLHQITSEGDGIYPDTPQVFALSSSNPDLLLDCINDLLKGVGYTPLAMNESGLLVSEPYRDPAERASELTLDLRTIAGAKKTSIVDIQRTKTIEGLGRTNWWRFIRRGMPTAPVEGAGWYTPFPLPTGQVRPYTETVDVASQDALKAYGDAKVVADTTQAVTMDLTMEPRPDLGFAQPDIVTVIDDETNVNGRAQVTKWTQDYGQAEVHMTVGVL